MTTVEKTYFDIYKGREVSLYTLSNECLSVGVIDFGAAVQYLKVRTPDGEKDVCLGFADVENYIQSGMYCGATVGRVANRIKDGAFRMNGETIHLSKNQGANHHHGGFEGFDKKFFAGSIIRDGNGEQAVIMALISPNGDEGYPGQLAMSVMFSLAGNEFRIQYRAISDKDTLWAPTSHIYFCLDGEKGGISDTDLQIYAERFTPCDSESIPTGEYEDVIGTPFDFTVPKKIGKDIDAECEQLLYCRGYDHNYELEGEHAATAKGASGMTVDIYSDMPGVHFYTGNYIDCIGKNGYMGFRSGFALEPQFFPNAVNTDGFAKPYLPANNLISHWIRYIFTSSGAKEQQ